MSQGLDTWEKQWTTDMGFYVPSERAVLRGRDLFSELNALSWMALLIYGVTGRMPDSKQVALLNAIWTLVTSYPDPRLWNNRIGTLAGVSRSTAALGISAGIAVSEAVVYGQQPILGAARLFNEVAPLLSHKFS